MSAAVTSPNSKEPQAPLPNGPTKAVQRVIRQPNGRISIVNGSGAGAVGGPNSVGGAASSPAGGAAGGAANGGVGPNLSGINAATLSQLRMGQLNGRQVGGGSAGMPTLQQRVAMQQQQQQQQGMFGSPKTVRMLIHIRNIAFFIVAIALLNMVATNAGPLPTVIVGYIMYKGKMFILVTNMLGKLKRALSGDEAAYELALRRADSMRAPVTKKEGSISQRAKAISYGFSCMQGWRRSMEDAHTMILDGVKHDPHVHTPPPQWRIPTSPVLGAIHNQGVSTGKGGFFAVFDGHCGPRVAHYCSEHLYHFVCKSPAWAKKNYKQALIDGFVAMDQHLYSACMEERSGCTAVAVLISEDGKKLYCANAGDSRAIVGQQREGSAVHEISAPAVDGTICIGNGFESLSEDHKPYNRGEQLRIQKAGGVVFNKRVNGILALSRAIGDFSFKKNKAVPWVDQAVTCMPDVKELAIDLQRDQFIVLACDGIWDVRTNEDVAAFVRLRLKKKMALHTICEQLMQSCLSNRPFGNGCDNMSVVIVTLDESAFMQSVGGPSAGLASPAVRMALPSPGITPAKLSQTATPDTGAAAAPASLATVLAAATASDSSETTKKSPAVDALLPLCDGLNEEEEKGIIAGSATANARKARKGSTPPPALALGGGTAGEKKEAATKVAEDGESVVEEIASPSSVRVNVGFPAVESVPTEAVKKDQLEEEAKADDGSSSAAAITDDEDVDGGAAHSAAADGNADAENEDMDEDAAEEAKHKILKESLEAAELFSPKTPAELREGDSWAAADVAAKAGEDEDSAEGGAKDEE